MLQPADVLLLDEPTNDLDIPTLEILEESLLEYRGALVLVTHDRYMLDRVSTVVLGFNGLGEAERFADYAQWDIWQGSRQSKGKPNVVSRSQSARAPAVETKSAVTRKKLSYVEAREFATIEERIGRAEQELRAKRAALEDPAIVSDRLDFRDTCAQFEEAQKVVDRLYARWAELEKKKT
jgi:ATP-binding cassette subfamily F protein uup